MKKYYALLCFFIIGVSGVGHTLEFSTQTICCPKETSEQDCCTQYENVWCSAQKICVPYEGMCEAICSRQPVSTNCICASVKIDVTPQNSSAQMTYCCDPLDSNKRDCCLAMGYTWVGPNKNTGTCTAPKADVCLDMLVGGEPPQIFH